MSTAPIVIHRPSHTGARRVTIRDEIVGIAHSDHDLVVFLEAAGLDNPDGALDDPRWVEWRGGHAHEWDVI